MDNTDLEAYKQIGRTAKMTIAQCDFAPRGISHGGIVVGLGSLEGLLSPILSTAKYL